MEANAGIAAGMAAEEETKENKTGGGGVERKDGEEAEQRALPFHHCTLKREAKQRDGEWNRNGRMCSRST